MAIDTVHIVHHTHHDYGYTDHPRVAVEQFERFHEQALDLIHATSDYPDEARFRWTCEVFDPTWRFWQNANAGRRRAFRKAVEEGRIEVGMLPWTAAAFGTRASLDHAWERSGDLWTGMRSSFAMQVDVNGVNWGLVPWLLDRGGDLLWHSANPYSGRNIERVPTLRRWEGPDGRDILLLHSANYPGWWFFSEHFVRPKGPQVRAHDYWFTPPAAGEIFRADAAGLAEARRAWARCQPDAAAWPWPVVALPLTNQWRCDNDPPFPGLSDFVRAWNDAGEGPRLIISTPARFLRDFLSRVSRDSLPMQRGDIPDWWADAPMAMPEAVSSGRRANGRLASLVALARGLQTTLSPMACEKRDRALDAAALLEEHTMGAQESLPDPSASRSRANLAFRLDLAATAEDYAMGACQAALADSPLLGRFSRDQVVGVINPGDRRSGGFVGIPAHALRDPNSVLEDVRTGGRLALEAVLGPDMEADPSATPTGLPWLTDDEFGFRPVEVRALIPPLEPGEVRLFRVVQGQGISAEAAGRLPVALDHAGTVTRLQLTITGQGVEMIGSPGPDGAGFGEPVIEAPVGRGIRTRLLKRSVEHATGLLRPQRASVSYHAVENRQGFTRVVRRWLHPALQMIQQHIDLPHGADWCQVSTRVVIAERMSPVGLHLAFPWAGDGASVRYAAMGWPTQPGVDQVPGASGEFIAAHPWVSWQPCPMVEARVSCTDTPLWALDSIATRSGRTPFVPTSCRMYAVLHQSWWNTNFPSTQSGTWDFVHRIELQAAGTSAPMAVPLFAFPAKLP